MEKKLKALPDNPTMSDFQALVHALESHHGWLDVDLVHNCFLMGEEVGELFAAIRRYNRYFKEAGPVVSKEDVAFEIVDVLNFLLAIANRLDIDVEAAFRAKNERNFTRSWSTEREET